MEETTNNHTYPFPENMDAIDIKDGTRYEVDHFTISEAYRVKTRCI